MLSDRDMSIPASTASDHRPLYVTAVLSVCLHVLVIAAVLRLDIPWFSDRDSAAPAGVLDVSLAGAQPAAATGVQAIPPVPLPEQSDGPVTVGVRAQEPLPPVPRPSPRPVHDSDRYYPSASASADTTISLAGLQVPDNILPALDISPWVPDMAVQMEGDEQQMLDRHLETWLSDPEQLVTAERPIEWEFEGAVYQASATVVPAQSATGLDRTIIEVSTRRGGRLMSARVQLKRLAFSHYAQFVNTWDPDVYLSRDRIEGRFHSNSSVNIDTSQRERPQFAGPVTIAAAQRQGRWLHRSGMFEGGLQTMADRIPLIPDANPETGVALSDGARVHRFVTDVYIQFHADGGFSWWPSGQPETAQRESATTGVLMLVAEDGVTLAVHGQVAGQVLLYSPRMILITGDLVYANDPLLDEHSDDWLSLISDHTIQIADAGVTGPGDLHIHGALYARNRFSVRGFRARNGDSVLSITGSLVSGSVSATEPRYATRVVFDPRLESSRTPGFPMTSQYVIEARDEHWRLAASR